MGPGAPSRLSRRRQDRAWHRRRGFPARPERTGNPADGRKERHDPARRAGRGNQGWGGSAGTGEGTGTLDPGKSADLIAVDGDPLNDATAVQHVRYVMVRGRVVPMR